METAKRIRTTQGKHVIPVPTFEIKKDFFRLYFRSITNLL